MSILQEKLENLSKARPAPMGFGSSSSRKNPPPFLVIASLNKTSLPLASKIMQGGADLLLADESEGPLAELPWGTRMVKGNPDQLERLRQQGCDFVVFAAETTSAGILSEEGLGKVLEVESPLSEGFLRVIEDLPVDAVLQKGESIPLTVQVLASYLSLRQLCAKPLLVWVDPEIDTKELEVLRDAGVNGLMVEVKKSSDVGRLTGLCKTVASLGPPKRPRERAMALMPSLTRSTKAVSPDEDDDEEEGDRIGPGSTVSGTR